MTTYTAPVDALLSYGDCQKRFRTQGPKWPDYVGELGFNETHIDALIAMATDPALNQADSDSLAVWAPTHAWRALGQLRAAAAVGPLLRLLDTLGPDDEWTHEELPRVFAMIGEPALEPVSAYLLDAGNDDFSRAAMARALAEIAKRHPEHGARCGQALLDGLRRCADHTPMLNGSLIAALLDGHQAGAMDVRAQAAVIERAFQANAVDCSVAGDWEDVQIDLGLLDERLTPARNYLAEQLVGRDAPVVKPAKIGRNDPCPCGSGKKYKKCCLLKERHGEKP